MTNLGIYFWPWVTLVAFFKFGHGGYLKCRFQFWGKKRVTLHFVPFHFVPGHFVPITLSPGHFVPGHFVPGHFVPWSLCLPVNLSSSHIVPRSLAQDKKDRDAFTNSTTVKPLCQGSPGRRQNLALHFLFGQICQWLTSRLN
jgi:hypothetical protein